MVPSLMSCISSIAALPTLDFLKCWLLRKLERQVAKLPQFRFIILHHLFFIVIALLSSVVLYGASLVDPIQAYRYVDCLFFAVSAVTETGLITVTPSQLNFAQQFIAFLLIIIGSPISISVVVLYIRKRAFHRRFCSIINEQRTAESRRHGQDIALTTIELPLPALVDDSHMEGISDEPQIDGTSSSSSDTIAMLQISRLSTVVEIEEAPPGIDSIKTAEVVIESRDAQDSEDNSPTIAEASQIGSPGESTVRSSPLRAFGLFNLTQFVGRNGQFHGLTTREREALGCVEYKAVKLLMKLVLSYCVFCQAAGALILAVYFSKQKAELCQASGINPIWMGVFHSVSAFNNAGIMFMDDSMGPFKQDKIALLGTMGLMLAGNVCFPIFLRAILFTWLRCLPSSAKYDSQRDKLDFILE